jgi:hypothetical protein
MNLKKQQSYVFLIENETIFRHLGYLQKKVILFYKKYLNIKNGC